LPRTRLLLVEIAMPDWLLPEMTLRSLVRVPPMFWLLALFRTRTPDPPFAMIVSPLGWSPM